MSLAPIRGKDIASDELMNMKATPKFSSVPFTYRTISILINQAIQIALAQVEMQIDDKSLVQQASSGTPGLKNIPSLGGLYPWVVT